MFFKTQTIFSKKRLPGMGTMVNLLKGFGMQARLFSKPGACCSDDPVLECCSAGYINLGQECDGSDVDGSITARIRGIEDGSHSVVFKVSENNGASWTTLATVSEAFTNTEFTDDDVIDLTAYAGSRVLIGLFVAGATEPNVTTYVDVISC